MSQREQSDKNCSRCAELAEEVKTLREFGNAAMRGSDALMAQVSNLEHEIASVMAERDAAPSLNARLARALEWALLRIRTSLDMGDLYAEAEAALKEARAPSSTAAAPFGHACDWCSPERACHDGSEACQKGLKTLAPSATASASEVVAAFDKLIEDAPLDHWGTGGQESAERSEKAWAEHVAKLRAGIVALQGALQAIALMEPDQHSKTCCEMHRRANAALLSPNDISRQQQEGK